MERSPSCGRTKLKPDQNGEYYRNLGWKKTRTGQRSQHKFLLGTNKKEAEARNALLERLWQSIEERYGATTDWDEFALEVAKAIANGETEVASSVGKNPHLSLESHGATSATPITPAPSIKPRLNFRSSNSFPSRPRRTSEALSKLARLATHEPGTA